MATDRRSYDAAWRAKNREKIRANQRRWASENREKERARHRAYRDENPGADRAYYERTRDARLAAEKERYANDAEYREAKKARSRARHEAKRDEILAQKRARAAEQYDPEAERERKQRFRREHPVEYAERMRVIKYRRRGAGPETTDDREWWTLILSDPCAYCGVPAESVDHIVPISAGGDGAWANVVGACLSCNKKKLNRSLLVFLRGER